MLAVEIPDGYLIALIPLIGAALFGFIGWMVTKMVRLSENERETSTLLGTISRQQQDHESRLRVLERPR